MSIAKDQLEEQDRRHFGNPPNKCVCTECVSNEDWKDWINQNTPYGEVCDYCITGNIEAVVTLEQFLYHCMEYVNEHYVRAEEDEGIYPNEETGEYPVTTWDTYDLVHEILAEEAGIENPELLKDMTDTIYDYTWCEEDPFSDH